MNRGEEEVMDNSGEEEEEWMSGLVEKEGMQRAEPGYTNHLIAHHTSRQIALNWILKAHTFYGFDPTTAVLAVNFLDRFLSRAYHKNKMVEGKYWMPQLLSVACLSLAAKMEETEVPLLLDLQEGGGETEHIFEPMVVQRMELLVLSTLDWRMNSVTPFSYLNKFILKLGIEKRYRACLLSSIGHLIFQTLKDIRFVKYWASIIAATTTMYCIRELLPLRFYHLKETLLTHYPLCKEDFSRCFQLMDDLMLVEKTRVCRPSHVNIKNPICYYDINDNEDSHSTKLGCCIILQNQLSKRQR